MRVKKQGRKTIHAGAEAWDGLHPYCDTDSKGWRATHVTAPVNCKRCLRIMERERVEAATKEHEDEPIDLTSTINDMIEGWLQRG